MPNRIIKESLCDSEKIAALSDFEFRLWVGLITQADDAGRGDARPAIIKGRVFPFRERLSIKDIDAALQELAAKGCVSLYTVDGRPYFLFPGWVKHQRIRDCKPKFPEPPENTVLQQSAASRGNLRQVAAICGESRQSAAICGNLRRTAAICGLNPIRIQERKTRTPRVSPHQPLMLWRSMSVRRAITSTQIALWPSTSRRAGWSAKTT